ncbi:MAG TPA: PDZ domain-containing protein [Gemmatimonadaceae bacterium]|nr:PDZ domain-containing protein [Gemmatimonadaceae bacterium]
MNMFSRALAAVLTIVSSAQSQQRAAAPATPRTERAATDSTSVPVGDVSYEVTFTRQTAAERTMRVTTTFSVDAAATGPVLLSLPAWTPGAYEISNFARWVVGFSATSGSTPLTWDKLDYDTWRILPPGVTSADGHGGGRTGRWSGPVTVTFSYRADTLDNAMSWSRPDFLLFNGTNVFMYPAGRALSFPSRVTVRTESDWNVSTSMKRSSNASPAVFTASNYHELVDMPFFIGRFAVDSAEISGKWMRFASYPANAVQGAARAEVWDQLKKVVPPEVAVFGEVPWDAYTVMQIVDSAYQGASGLEHAASHVNVLAPVYIGSPFQPSLYAHEIFHAWNVKRLRPADLWPYHYETSQPTPWLWVSEGITDYYADLAEVRGGVVPDSGFYALTAGKINEVGAVTATALEDASLNTWVHPVDGSAYIYYPKGSLAGFMLDVLIRDASDNRQSLDGVMRELYTNTYKKGRGFTSEDWWSAVSRAAGGKSFADFERKYIEGREPFPWNEILPVAGLRSSINRVPRIGIATTEDAQGIKIEQVDPQGSAAAAGVKPGDYLLAVNEIAVEDQSFGPKFRAAFADAKEGMPLTLRVRRGTQTLTLTGTVQLAPGDLSISADPNASPKAVRIRNGILKGTTDR